MLNGHHVVILGLNVFQMQQAPCGNHRVGIDDELGQDGGDEVYKTR